MMNAKGPILAADLAGMLIFGGFMDAAAQDDPAGYDNYRTMEKVGYLADLLNARVAAETASAASHQAAAAGNSARPDEPNEAGSAASPQGSGTAEFEAIMSATEGELDAMIRADGGDPADYAARGGAAIATALAQMESATRGATCPMCGTVGPHEHTPAEIVIFRNGAKFALASSAALNARAQPATQAAPQSTRQDEQTMETRAELAEQNYVCAAEERDFLRDQLATLRAQVGEPTALEAAAKAVIDRRRAALALQQEPKP